MSATLCCRLIAVIELLSLGLHYTGRGHQSSGCHSAQNKKKTLTNCIFMYRVFLLYLQFTQEKIKHKKAINFLNAILNWIQKNYLQMIHFFVSLSFFLFKLNNNKQLWICLFISFKYNSICCFCCMRVLCLNYVHIVSRGRIKVLFEWAKDWTSLQTSSRTLCLPPTQVLFAITDMVFERTFLQQPTVKCYISNMNRKFDAWTKKN